MAKTIGEVLNLFAKVGQFDILNIEMNNNRDTEHKILHRFKEVLILPIHCITSNLDFIMCIGKKTVITADKVKCRVVQWKELHLLDSEEEIQKLYGISAWEYARRYYEYDHNMQSMTLIKMKLEREEQQ